MTNSAQLRLQNRLLLVACGLLAATLLIGQADPPLAVKEKERLVVDEIVRCRGLEVVNDKGEVRVAVSTDRDGGMVIIYHQDTGRPVALVAAHGDRGVMSVGDRDDKGIWSTPAE